MTEKIKAAILGFGTVGQGVYQSIQSHQSRLKQLLGKEVEVAGILIQHPEKERDVDESVIVTTQFEDILAIPGLQVIFEAIVGEEPGHTYLSMAIEKGIHVITANKVMFARHGQELLKKAKENGVQIGFEATTAGGTPILQTLALLRVNEVEEIQGILNGTSNFILFYFIGNERKENQFS
ncbi:Gfo/Idh/MocA family oxidoreductase [Bacillus smithii]|uniref:Gfo/Idh/MocA family oxidoreductase n=1 Tax=Bacillus smithii TaxID=1479 RepID=UPI000AA35756|nr:Gfo/Idh/MocA family oxidoreductase [Bacillus smithii]MED4882672.1 Gfo/Idh/MocA family oxidoreductase [Bacillus smithii]MED4926429.1 Gfo/Idh/MocA family oxidoreductase [Bacillus smithii]